MPETLKTRLVATALTPPPPPAAQRHAGNAGEGGCGALGGTHRVAMRLQQSAVRACARRGTLPPPPASTPTPPAGPAEPPQPALAALAAAQGDGGGGEHGGWRAQVEAQSALLLALLGSVKQSRTASQFHHKAPRLGMSPAPLFLTTMQAPARR